MSNWSSGEILSKDKLNEMEDNLSSVTSTYIKTTWNDEDIVTADKLNNLENGISTFIPTYSKHTWVDNEEITSNKLNNLDIQINASKGVYNIGDVVVKDRIESVCIYKEETRQDWGQYIFIDKKHDLSYYITGSDYVNSMDFNTPPGTFGYEWGGYETETGITATTIGSGLSNTNTLISKNLQSYNPGWRILWDCIETFRVSHSNDWFVPSLNEFLDIYKQINYLENFSTTPNYYWTSSEFDSGRAYGFNSNDGFSDYSYKYSIHIRSRLCFYL